MQHAKQAIQSYIPVCNATCQNRALFAILHLAQIHSSVIFKILLNYKKAIALVTHKSGCKKMCLLVVAPM